MRALKLVAVGSFALALAAVAIAEPAATQPGTQPAMKPYPFKTCIVSGEKLGGMGDPVVVTYKQQEFKLCCKGCVKPFNKDPEKYLKKLEDAATQPAK
jgi:hypothetical protein